jgi:hypothetical protein
VCRGGGLTTAALTTTLPILALVMRKTAMIVRADVTMRVMIAVTTVILIQPAYTATTRPPRTCLRVPRRSATDARAFCSACVIRRAAGSTRRTRWRRRGCVCFCSDFVLGECVWVGRYEREGTRLVLTVEVRAFVLFPCLCITECIL